MTADPFAELMERYQQLIEERDAALQSQSEIAQEYEDTVLCMEIMEEPNE